MQLDTLDLNELTARMKKDTNRARRRWIIFFAVIGFLTLFYFWAMLSPAPSSSSNVEDKCNERCYMSVFIAFCPPILIVGIGLIALSNWRRRNNIQKPYLARLSNLNLPSIKINYWSATSALIVGWEILWLFLTINFELDFIAMIPILLPLVIFVAPDLWLKSTLNKGDYDGLIRQAHSFEQWLPYRSWLLPWEAIGHSLAGHVQDSENTYRLVLSYRVKGKAYVGLALNNYAGELIYQGRYQEALPLLETAVLAQPYLSCSYDTLAGWYLMQNLAPERALELAEFGLKLKTSPLFLNKSATHTLQLTNRAWAEARSGLIDRARETLKQVFAKADANNIPYFAELNRIAGETYLALNDIPLARQHFTKAAEVDPNGRIGKMARERLQTLPLEPDAPPAT